MITIGRWLCLWLNGLRVVTLVAKQDRSVLDLEDRVGRKVGLGWCMDIGFLRVGIMDRVVSGGFTSGGGGGAMFLCLKDFLMYFHCPSLSVEWQWSALGTPLLQ